MRRNGEIGRSLSSLDKHKMVKWLSEELGAFFVHLLVTWSSHNMVTIRFAILLMVIVP
jgi:hypothetical protein